MTTAETQLRRAITAQTKARNGLHRALGDSRLSAAARSVIELEHAKAAKLTAAFESTLAQMFYSSEVA